MWLKGVLIPKLFNNPLASFFLDLLLSNIADFDQIVGFSLFVFATLEFLVIHFFCTSNNTITLSYK